MSGTRPASHEPGQARCRFRGDARLRLGDVVAHFRNEGRGWQTRLNAVLRRAVFKTADDHPEEPRWIGRGVIRPPRAPAPCRPPARAS